MSILRWSCVALWFWALSSRLARTATPRLLRGTGPRLTSFAELVSRFGRATSARVHAKGRARWGDALLVEPDDWDGLVGGETVEEAAKRVARGDEGAGRFGSLKSMFFEPGGAWEELVKDEDRPPEWTTSAAALDGWTLWMRKFEKERKRNAVGWHAHPDWGVYYQLLGNKTFYYLHPDVWRSEISYEFDTRFPIVFGDEEQIARLPIGQVRSIRLSPGDVLYQPPWFMHYLEYDGTGEFLSLRRGGMSLLTIGQDFGLFVRCVPMFLDVGWEIAKPRTS